MGGLLQSTHNGRVYLKGQMVGQDEILFKKDRKYSLLALTECHTLKMDREIFESILRDYPEISIKLNDEADFRHKVTTMDS